MKESDTPEPEDLSPADRLRAIAFGLAHKAAELEQVAEWLELVELAELQNPLKG